MINTPITACILTRDDESNIGACLASLQICDEIIVVDAHSTDRTREIAAATRARFVQREWSGRRTQLQFAVMHASHDWVLSIDAHERVSGALSREIRVIRPYGLGGFAGYEVATRDSAENLRSGYRVRLFDRRRATIRSHGSRELIVPHGPIGRLAGEVLLDAGIELPA